MYGAICVKTIITMPYSLAVKNRTKWFVDTYGDGIAKAIRGTNLYFPAIVAQKALESGWGDSSLAKIDNNFGGIKCAPKLSGVVGCVSKDTTEYVRGRKVFVKQSFSKFKDVESGIKATIEVLMKDRYADARNKATSAKDQILRIASAGYTTTPAQKYLNALSGIIEATQDYTGLGRIK
jgi:flagellum-specific peptidoglycan hydrolase FlgJ